MSHLDGRWRPQSLVYFGSPQDSSVNVAAGQRLSGASRVSSRGATLKYLIAADNYGEF